MAQVKARLIRFLERPVVSAVMAAVAAVFAVVVYRGTVAGPLGACPAHLLTQFAGSKAAIDEGFRQADCRGLDLETFRSSFGWDFLLALLVAITLWAVLNLVRDAWQVDRIRRLVATATWAVPLVALLADWTENILTLSFVDGPPLTVVSDGQALALTTVAWVKWTALAVGLAMVVPSSWAMLRKRHQRRPPTATPDYGSEAGRDLAICFSGGGIRAAGFALGVLSQLDQAEHVLKRLRAVSAVSGGAYAATTWRLLRHVGIDRPARWMRNQLLKSMPREAIRLTRDEPDVTERKRTRSGAHRFLANGPGGLTRSLSEGLGVVTVGVIGAVGLIVVLSWPLGHLMRFLIEPEEGSVAFDIQDPAHWAPGAILAAAGLGIFALSLLRSHLATWHRTDRVSAIAIAAAVFGVLVWAGANPWISMAVTVVGFVSLASPLARFLEDSRVKTVGVGLIGAGVAVALVGAVVPWAIVTVHNAVQDTEWLALLLGSAPALAGGGALAFLARAIVKPLGQALPRLGGVLLALAGLLLAGKVMSDVVYASGWYADRRVFIVAVVVIILLFAADLQWLSLRSIYDDRLRHAFGHDDDSVGTRLETITWSDLNSHSPTLVIGSAVHRMGFARVGTAAESFSISPDTVRQGRRGLETAFYLNTLPTRLGHLRFVSSWMAVTGAAFASAMGALSVGSTNALLAALNIDLGIWLPSLDKIAPGTPTSFRRVGLGYWTKEVLGLYDDNDDYVFVADGGHWENLGLVELLRFPCRHYLCIDASGDPPGSFRTLKAAVDLALIEYEDLTIDLGPLVGPAGTSEMGATRKEMVVRLPYRRGANFGYIIYAKLQLSDDMPSGVRRFAQLDRQFPHYSTANQLLDDQQFAAVVGAGDHAGRRIIEILEGLEQPDGGRCKPP